MTGDTPRLAGAEALVRWQSKTEGGMISPGKNSPSSCQYFVKVLGRKPR